jgi:hypothetical protein
MRQAPGHVLDEQTPAALVLPVGVGTPDHLPEQLAVALIELRGVAEVGPEIGRFGCEPVVAEAAPGEDRLEVACILSISTCRATSPN